MRHYFNFTITVFRNLNKNFFYSTFRQFYILKSGRPLTIYNGNAGHLINLQSTSAIKKRKVISNVNELVQHINDGKQFYLKLLTNILNTVKIENTSSEHAVLLLNCCGKSVADSSRQERNETCQNIYNSLLKCEKLDLIVCHAYIQVCTENDVLLNAREFIDSLKETPNQKTYKLLLENVCENGNVDQAFDILTIMKQRNISADEEVFNQLILAHTIQSGSKGAESVLLTMRSAQILETINTKYAILKGVSKRNNELDFENVLSKYPMELTDLQLMEILELLGLHGNVTWVSKVKIFCGNLVVTREFINNLEKVCIHLVHMNKSEASMNLYEEFVKPSADNNYGFFILKEMLHCNVAIDRILHLAKHLRDNETNIYALEKLTELSLKHNYTEVSWKLLENLSTLRPHFFWPILLNAEHKDGEAGVFDVLKNMVKMNVNVDSVTLENYVLPFCSLSNSKLLVKKLQDFKLTVRDILSPLIIVLLQNNEVKKAADLCNEFHVYITGEKILQLLSSNWNKSNPRDTNSVVLLLQKYCESNTNETDLVGNFLVKTLSECKIDADFKDYQSLLKLIRERRLKVSTAFAENLRELCLSKYENNEDQESIRNEIDKLVDFGLKPEPSYIPHPRNMGFEDLECHLLELQEKNMETRGILRKLIQLHSNLGNLQRVEELRQQFLSAGYEETSGMKSSLMHSYTNGGHLEPALNIYKEIKDKDPSFKMDIFKIIDLSSLLVKMNKFNEAMELLKKECESKKIIGGPTIERNCWMLLQSFTNENEQDEMFHFLVKNGICQPTNKILGPMMRIHLIKGDLNKIADKYVKYTKEYRRTPLQLEVIRAILKSENEALLQKVLNATEKIHGPVSTQTVLIAALAENGQEKPLRKIFANNKLDIKKHLQKRCERWIQETKVEALQTLANVCHRLPKEVFDINIIFKCMLEIYSLNNDYKSTLNLYEDILEKEITVDIEIKNEINKILKQCNQVKKVL